MSSFDGRDHRQTEQRNALLTKISFLEAENARLKDMLYEVRHNGLVYWEPNTLRGAAAKAKMLAEIDAATGAVLAVDEVTP